MNHTIFVSDYGNIPISKETIEAYQWKHAFRGKVGPTAKARAQADVEKLCKTLAEYRFITDKATHEPI